MNKEYEYYTQYHLMSRCELYSGGENDPIEMARIDAEEHLAYDSDGNKLPYLVRMSIFALDIDRDKEMLEDMCVEFRRDEQKIAVHVVVFRDYEVYERYKELDFVEIKNW